MFIASYEKNLPTKRNISINYHYFSIQRTIIMSIHLTKPPDFEGHNDLDQARFKPRSKGQDFFLVIIDMHCRF